MSLKSRVKPYAWAILGTAIAVSSRLLLAPLLGNPLFYGTLYVAVVASAVFGGLGPAIVATLLGAIAADYFIIPPHFTFQLKDVGAELSLALYLVVSGVLIGFAEKQRRARQQQIVASAQAEAEAVRASEERFRRLVEVSSQAVWVANDDSLSRRPLTEQSQEQWLDVPNWLDAVHPDDRQRAAGAWRKAVETATPYQEELRVRCASGGYRYLSSHAAPVFNADGTVREWIGMSADITDRRRAEQALAEAVQRLDAHMDNSPLGVIEFNRQFRVTRWSKEAEKIFGWNAEEVLGRKIMEMPLIYEDDREAVSRLLQDMAEGRNPRNLSVNRNYRKDGEVLECEWYSSAIYDKDGNLTSVLAQILDITGRKQTEERLRQSLKMDSIAVLAGGMAHDFNNLLVGIIGNASLALEADELRSGTRDLLDGIVKSGEQAAYLTSQILAYSGRGRFVVEPVNLSEVVREVTTIVRASTSRKIAFKLDLDPELPSINADRGQIHQVLLNLIVNAAEAIGENEGSIALRTGLRHLDEDSIQELETRDIPPGAYVFLEVLDTGYGMNEETKAKIFDPFFTTKFTGRGLGLAAASGIVRAQHGAIQVSTAPGEGASFTILLPAAGTRTAAPQIVRDQEELQERGTILFVDDEEAVRQMAKRALERHGYEVLLATNGREAIEALKESAARTDLVVLDLSMPGKSGQEALPELQKIKPGLQVLVSSGYGKDEVLGRFAGSPIAGFIQKPYSVQQLVNKVEEGMTTREKLAGGGAHG